MDVKVVGSLRSLEAIIAFNVRVTCSGHSISDCFKPGWPSEPLSSLEFINIDGSLLDAGWIVGTNHMILLLNVICIQNIRNLVLESVRK